MLRSPTPHTYRRLLAVVAAVAVIAAPALTTTSCGESPVIAGDTKHFAGSGGTVASGGSGGQDVLAGNGGTGNGSGSGGSGNVCTPACDDTRQCQNGVCIPKSDCDDNNDCSSDTRCTPEGCVPWADGASDPDCDLGIDPGQFAPTVKCEFSEPPAGDAFMSHRDVQATPVVVNFRAQSGGIPSIVAPFTATVAGGYTENQGIIRVLRGDDCTLEANLGGGSADYGGWITSSASVAVGDLDGDLIADIVAPTASGHLVAFAKKSNGWTVLWESQDAVPNTCWGGPTSCTWAGASIHDLNDDGLPEVIHDGTIINGQTGATLSPNPASYATFSRGINPVLANLDADPFIELTNGGRIWEWDTTQSLWAEQAVLGAGTPGFPAVADFGAFGAGAATDPEIVSVTGGTVTVYSLDGAAVFGPIAIRPGPNGGQGGGNPTVADYDGDGLAEIGVAGEAFLSVYDPDCTVTPRAGGTCSATASCDDNAGNPGACTPNGGILWSRRTQDESSNITGSSVFDFEADGKAEVVYADECFVRVYDGTDGTVVFSQYRSSCTWYENPIVADTDGNFRADLVTPSNLACAADTVQGIACGTPFDAALAVDGQFAGLRCESGSDCVSGACDAGLCRCAQDADCCGAQDAATCLEEGYLCVPPPAGTAGNGNTCRAAHPHGVNGIRVYSDAQDRWVRSRTIWSQHAYAVTHINEDGTVPKTSEWAENWLDPTLNNFRQNVPGTANGQATPDLTAGTSAFACDGSSVTLQAPLCNRGAESVGAGITAGFYVNGVKVCDGATAGPLAPGECEDVQCEWADPPPTAAQAVDVDVFADDGGVRTECYEGNNHGFIEGVFCKPVA